MTPDRKNTPDLKMGLSGCGGTTYEDHSPTETTLPEGAGSPQPGTVPGSCLSMVHGEKCESY